MSYTEFHKGKLRILTRSTKETLDYINKHDLKRDFTCDIDDDEIDIDTNNPKYFVLHKDSKYYGKDMDCWLCEFIEHIEQEGGGDYFVDVKCISKDEYEFTCIFFNGGTCLHEILDEEISKLENEPYDPEFEMVKIFPRESYMILDVFQFALMHMNIENLEYLFNNYSREEIANFGQKFGDMNLKNGW